MADDPVTVGELSRWMRAIQQELATLGAKVDATYVRHDTAMELRRRIEVLEADRAYRHELSEVRRDIDETRANLTWAWRAVAGLVIAGLGSAALAGMRALGG